MGRLFRALSFVSLSGSHDGRGLRAPLIGEEILQIDGQSAVRLDLPTVRLRFKNDPSKKRVRLVLRRGGEKREISLVLRDPV